VPRIPVKRTKRAPPKVANPVRKGSQPPPRPEPTGADSFPIAGIGASAGGLEAFRELLIHLRKDAGMAYVLVPHLDPDHHSVLAEILSRFAKIPITEVMDGMPVQRDHIYVIPPNKTMGIAGDKFVLVERDASHTPHLPIDHFFTALANDRGDQAIGIVLSGTASDGTQGCIAIKVAGGITLRRMKRPRNIMTCRGMRSAAEALILCCPLRASRRNLLGSAAASAPAESRLSLWILI
jgi:two-component system CheB/CheR fusion protein